jgi:hypothetical protein
MHGKETCRSHNVLVAWKRDPWGMDWENPIKTSVDWGDEFQGNYISTVHSPYVQCTCTKAEGFHHQLLQ